MRFICTNIFLEKVHEIILNVGNFRAPRRQQAPAQLTPPMGGVSLKLFYDGPREDCRPTAAAPVFYFSMEPRQKLF